MLKHILGIISYYQPVKNNLKTEVLNIWSLDKIEQKEIDIKCGGTILKNKNVVTKVSK